MATRYYRIMEEGTPPGTAIARGKNYYGNSSYDRIRECSSARWKPLFDLSFALPMLQSRGLVYW